MPIPATDFSIFDWQELVTYAPVSDEVVENVRALRRPLTKSSMRNVERYVELVLADVVFHLEGASLALKMLGTGDLITDANGVVYQSMAYEWQTFGSTIAVVCRKLD